MSTPIVPVGDVEIGVGRPKIIVPLTSEDASALAQDAAALAGHPVDLVEWRIDHYGDDVLAGARLLKRSMREPLPVLVTFRTAAEGGERAIGEDDYLALLRAVCADGAVDLVDIEAFRDQEVVRAAIDAAHAAGVVVIGSHHDFEATPAREEIVRRLRHMQDLGMDIAKIAVMPHDPGDVLTLLRATWEVASLERTPLITMSMGPSGVVSRVAGRTFGSACTFGALGATSAPGQIGVEELAAAMDAIAP